MFEITSEIGRENPKLLLRQLEALLGNQRDWLANQANTAAFLNQVLPRINWVGFYLNRGETLVLGPFQGKPACDQIAPGKGVCGTAAAEKRTVIVDDVNEFPGHIACDAASNSEIVVPLILEGRVLGVLDVDSPELKRFGSEDAEFLENVVDVLLRASDW